MPTATATRPVRKPARTPTGTCRLSLSINGVLYAIRRLECDPGAARVLWRLRKADGTSYHVARTDHGDDCSCPDFIFNRDGFDAEVCKHIRSLRACGLLP
jgi:hypothetical protein